MGSGGSKNKQQAPVNAQVPRDYYQDPSQRALGNVTHSMPPKQQNTMKEQMPPPITTGPIRQQTQPLPVQANPLPKQQMQQSQSNQAIHQPVQSDSPQSQMQRQPTFAPKKVVQEQEEAQEYDDSPNTLFLFDFQEKVFYYYNTVTSEWKYNDLTSAMDNCPRCPLMKYRLEGEESTAIQFAKYMSYIALSDDLVYLIGGYNSFFSCLVYNIKKNSFFTRSPINVCRNNPSLCRFNGYIYAVSGDQIDSYSTDVSVYDAQNDEWNALPELPYPQGLSSACVIYGKKLAVLGGLTLKFPKTYSPLLSIYTFGQRDWEVFDLTKVLTQRIPRFINSAMIQNREGDLIILGCEGTKFVHKFDLENLQIATCGRLPEEDSFSLQMRSKEALYRNNLVFCLSHKLDMKVYQGYLTLEKWETI